MLVSAYAIPGIDTQKSLRRPSQADIYERVCRLYGYSTRDVTKGQKTRKREFVEIRQLTMTLTRLHWGELKSLDSIGSFFNKDHSTVIHSMKTIKNIIDTDKIFRNKTSCFFWGLEWPDKFDK